MDPDILINNKNKILKILNKRGFHLNEYDTIRFVSSFSYNMNVWQYEICMEAQSATEIEDSPLTKTVNENLVFNIYKYNTYRPANLTVDNNRSLSKTNSVERRLESCAFLSVVADRLQNPKNITIGHSNVISLRNKIEAVTQLIINMFALRN